MSETEDKERKSADEELLENLEDPTNGLLTGFLEEYKKLQQSLKRCHANENEYVKECKGLIAEVKGIKKQKEDYFEFNRRIGLEISSCDRRLTDITVKHSQVEEEIKEKKVTVEHLYDKQNVMNIKLDNADNALKEENDRKVMEMHRKVETLTQKRDVMRTNVNTIWTTNLSLQNEVKQLQNKKEKEQNAIGLLTQKTNDMYSIIKNHKNKNEELLLCIQECNIELEEQNKKLEINNQNVATHKKLTGDVQNNLEKTKLMFEEHDKAMENMGNRDLDLMDQIACQMSEQTHVKDSIRKESHKLNQLQEKVKKLESDHAKTKRKTELLLGKFHELGKAHGEVEKECDNLDHDVNDLAIKKQGFELGLDELNKQKQLLFKEKVMLKQESKLQGNESAELKSQSFMNESKLKSFQNELAQIENIRLNLEYTIGDLNKSSHNLTREMNSKELKRCKLLEFIAEKDEIIAKLHESIETSQQSLEKQDNLLSAVRKDRNLYNRMLLEQREEMEGVRRELGSINHQIRQLSMELHEKDQSFLMEHFNVDQVDKDILITRSKIEGISKRVRKSKSLTIEQVKQFEALSKIISDVELEKKNQSKQFEYIINEDRILTQRLVKKNEELKILYSDLYLLNSLFLKGKSQFEDKSVELAKLKKGIKQKENELTKYKNQVAMHEESLRVIEMKEREIVDLKLKVAAFTDELQKPVNVHRWRTLVDTEPDTFDMIKKIQELNKEIIDNSNKVEEANIQIVQEEMKYIKLSKVLSRMPGEEAREQLRIYASSIQEKKGKLKTISAQLENQRNSVMDLKFELLQTEKELRLLDIEWIQAALGDLKDNIDPNSQTRGRMKEIGKTLLNEKRQLAANDI